MNQVMYGNQAQETKKDNRVYNSVDKLYSVPPKLKLHDLIPIQGISITVTVNYKHENNR